MSDAAPPPSATRPEKRKESWGETLRFLLLLFVAAFLLRSLVVAPFSIPSGSMLPRLMIGDYLFVAKWPFGYSRYSFPWGLVPFEGRVLGDLPERGDVVVFRYPGRGEDFVKRVIGLPGDTLSMEDGVPVLNGTPLPRQRIADWRMPVSLNSPCRAVLAEAVREENGACLYPRFRETLPSGRTYEVIDQGTGGPGDTMAPVTVPAGHVFVLGDNRDDSMDSRFAQAAGGVGMLPADHLLGRALITFWSTDGSAEWLKPWTWFSAARWERIGGTYE